MLRKLALTIGIIVLVCVAAVLTFSNPEPVTLDIGFARFEQVSLTLIIAVSVAVGWILGFGSAATTLLRSYAEKRQLRRQVRSAEDELGSLRNLPMRDAE